MIAEKFLNGLDDLNDEQTLTKLQAVWQNLDRDKVEFPIFESALLRVGKEFCRKSRCEICRLKTICQRAIQNLSASLSD